MNNARQGKWVSTVRLFTLLLPCFVSLSSLGEQANDPYFNSSGSWEQPYDDQWGLKRVGFSQDKNSAWTQADGSAQPVIVAVIDTGLDYHHPDLDKSNLWHNPHEQKNNRDDDGNGYVDDLIGWDFIDSDARPWDRTGHGTFVVGIIAASRNNGLGIAGINAGVKIMPLRALNFMGRGRSVNIAAAIYYAVANGARIINLSLGSRHVSRIETDAIAYATKQNVLVVVAGGNEGKATGDDGLAGLVEVITVGASDINDKRASFSNWGDEVDVVAPGVDILSLRARRTDLAYVAGVEDYRLGSNVVGIDKMLYRTTGTSFAAPFVTGVASLLVANNPKLTPAQVKRMILQSARDIETPGKDELTGYGLLDADAALTADPEFFIKADLQSVAVIQKGGSSLLQVTGTADANKIKKAWLEIGKGENPGSWKKLIKRIKTPTDNAVLGQFSTSRLAGSKQWTLRLFVEHKNGRKREGRLALNLD